jgi:endoglucanase
MAIAARSYLPFDRAYSQRTRQAAESAWNWVERNPSVLFHNPAGVTTGDYGDQHCSDEHLWAAAELARTTGNAAYHDYVRTHYRDFIETIRGDGPPSWSNVAPLALWTYALAGGKSDQQAVAAIVERSTQAATSIADRSAKNAYRIPLTSRDYIWGSNGVLANYALQLLIADRLHPDARCRQTAWESLHYLLGRNTFSLSFVTRVGENAVLHPHHRPSGSSGLPLPWPGLLSGGPNRARQDASVQKLPAGTPPARSFVDVTEAYSVNEVAINWNAPLVFVLAASLAE